MKNLRSLVKRIDSLEENNLNVTSAKTVRDRLYEIFQHSGFDCTSKDSISAPKQCNYRNTQLYRMAFQEWILKVDKENRDRLETEGYTTSTMRDALNKLNSVELIDSLEDTEDSLKAESE